MAVGAFPLAKLGVLAIKQISKPIANAIARRAKASRAFREYVCIPVAQIFHWYDVRVRMRILNLGKATSVPRLNEEKAIETGSQLLSEFIILGIASSIVFYEWRRSSEKEDAKEREATLERETLIATVSDLEMRLEEQRTQIRELTRMTHALAERQEKKWGPAVKAANKSGSSGGGGLRSYLGLGGGGSSDAEDEAQQEPRDVSRSFSSETVVSASNSGEDQDELESASMAAVNHFLDLAKGEDAEPASARTASPLWIGPIFGDRKVSPSPDEDYRPGMVLEAVEAFLDLREDDW